MHHALVASLRLSSIFGSILLLSLACSSLPPSEGEASPDASPGRIAPTESAPLREVVGRPVRFSFDPQDALIEWEEVASMAFGDGSQRLGSTECFHCEIVRPQAFAIGAGATLYVADNAKGRIAWYRADGTYLGHVGFQGASEIRDLEVSGADVFALFGDGGIARIDDQGGVIDRGVARHEGRALYLYDLLASADRVFAHSFGTAGGRGSIGPLELVDTGEIALDPVPGVAVSEGSSWVTLRGHGRNRSYVLELTARDGTQSLRPFKVLWPGGKAAQADVELLGVQPSRTIVSIEPLAPPWYSPINVGTWLVSLDAEGDVVAGVRVASPDTSPQVFSIDSSGSVYRMRYDAESVVVERLTARSWMQG